MIANYSPPDAACFFIGEKHQGPVTSRGRIASTHELPLPPRCSDHGSYRPVLWRRTAPRSFSHRARFSSATSQPCTMVDARSTRIASRTRSIILINTSLPEPKSDRKQHKSENTPAPEGKSWWRPRPAPSYRRFKSRSVVGQLPHPSTHPMVSSSLASCADRGGASPAPRPGGRRPMPRTTACRTVST